MIPGPSGVAEAGRSGLAKAPDERVNAHHRSLERLLASAGSEFHPRVKSSTFRAYQDELRALEVTHGATVLQLDKPTREEFLEEIASVAKEHKVTILLTTYSPILRNLNKDFVEPLLPSLRLVAGIGSGYEHVDVDFLTAHGVYYSNTPVGVSEPTALTTVMLILQTVRDATQAAANVRSGQWINGLGFTPDVRGLVVGIIGMGRIGKLVRDKVTALGMKVVYSNRKRLPEAEEKGATYLSFDELLQQAQLISIHCPLTPETRHLLSDEQFAKMQDGVFIVNTARGAVIDEAALVRAMQSGKVLRCGLDTFEEEPKVHPWLAESNRAALLPHFSCFTTRIFRDLELEILENIVAFMEKGTPNTPVNQPQ